MDYPEIEAFLKVVQFGTLAGAAHKLELTQSALSKRLSSLEEEVGKPLFKRKKGQKTVILTDAGINFVPVAKRWQSFWNEISTFTQSFQRPRLRLTMVPSLYHTGLRRALIAFLQDHRSIHLNCYAGDSFSVYQEIEDFATDLGFVTNYFDMEAIETVPFLEEDWAVIFGKTLVQEAPLDLSDFSIYDELLFNWGDSFMRWHKHTFGVSETAHILVENMDIYRFLLQTGKYWSILPAFEGVRYVCDNVAIDYHMQALPAKRTIYLLKRKNDTLLPEAQQFLCHIKKVCHRLPFINLRAEGQRFLEHNISVNEDIIG